ncbi:MAG: Dihydroneopterin aldolase [Firmicutes bacterium]|nr:Dihydroneopterin aldolase [Bacillota bacterium]
MTDKILLENMMFYGYHGFMAEERRLGQRFAVSLAIGTDIRAAAEADKLDLSINYAAVYVAVKEVVEGPPYLLLEALTERIAAVVLDMGAATVRVTVKKLHPPMPLQMDFVAVEITRERP